MGGIIMSESKWRCTICKYEVDGAKPPDKCPVCGAAAEMFEAIDAPKPEPEATPSLDSYLSQWTRNLHEEEEKFSLIQKLAKTGKSEISPMGTRKPFPGLDTILFRGAQFERIPSASELIHEAVVCLEFSGSSEDLARTCHAHPTLSEVVKEAALAVEKRSING